MAATANPIFSKRDPGVAPSERLRTRIVNILAILGIVPVVLGAIISLVITVSFTREEITRDQGHMAITIGNLVRTAWADTTERIQATASMLVRVADEQYAEILIEEYQLCEECQTVLLVDQQGHLLHSEGTFVALEPLQADIQATLRTSTMLVTTPREFIGLEPMPIIMVPVSVSDQEQYVLVAIINVQQFGQEILQDLSWHHAGYGYITDQTGHLLVSPQPSVARAGHNLQHIPLVAAALDNKPWESAYSQVYSGLLAPRVNGVWYRLPELGWYVFVEAPFSIANADIWSFFVLEATLLLLTIMVAVVFSKRLASTITRPIERLHAGVADLQAGRRITPLRIEQQDEIGQLAHAFNTMAQQLQAERLTLVSQRNELTLANRELERTAAAAKEANLIKSQFVATISHELRTPLTAILGYTELLEIDAYGALQEEQREIVTYISHSGKHLLQIINDILDFSKLEAGKLDLHETEYIFQELVDEVVQTSVPLAKAKGLAIHVDVDETVPAIVYGDILRLRQILLNLLSNAVKFTDTGSVTLRVRCTEAPNGTVYQVIEVVDTGIGLAPSDQLVIFDQFRQVDESTTRHGGGTGLGLTITKRLVEMMHGEITVTSTLGRGSCFTVTLPLAIEQMALEQ